MAISNEETETFVESQQQMDTDESNLAKYVYRANILDSVANSNGFFKSQQRGEKDLTFDEKREIADELLQKNIALFLQRYWKFINICDLSFFEDSSEDYEVNFYLQEIQKFSDDKKRRAICRNRRYEALKQMVKEGTYFSDEEMRQRRPYLFEQLVGKYMSDDSRSALRNDGFQNACFSDFLMDCIERDIIDTLMREQQEEEEGALEESDDDDDDEEEKEEEEEESDEDETTGHRRKRKSDLTEEEKQLLSDEFRNIMYESFLSGNDKDFDYSSVDNNEEYDSLPEREVDEQEKYFDAD